MRFFGVVLGKRWLPLLLVPVVVSAAVIYSGVLRSKAHAEEREQVFFLRFDGPFEFAGYVRGQLSTNPRAVASEQQLLASLDARAGAAVSSLRASSEGSDTNDRFQVSVLPRLYAAYTVLTRRLSTLLAAGETTQARAVYRRQIVPQYNHMRALEQVASAEQDASARGAIQAAFAGDLIGYGGAGTAVVVILAVLALGVRRSDRRAAEATLREAREHYRQIVETTSEGVWTLDLDNRTTFINRAMAQMLDRDVDDMVGRSVFEFIPADDLDQTRERLSQRREGITGKREVRFRRANGTELWTLVSSTPLYDSRGDCCGALALVSDISSRKRMETRLQFLAEHDPLTGIANRRQLISELDRQLRYANRYGHAGAVLTLDLDNFKFTNDTYGHPTGDAMIKSVAEILMSRARNTDIAARLGGDEFVVVLPESTEDDALTVARDIRALLCERPMGPPIMTSIGIALFTGKEQVTADELLVSADIALYEAKEHGGDQARVYRGEASGALTWVQRIRTALTEERFVLYGQPIIDLRSGRVIYHELLIRMLTDDGDIISPGAFLPTAERFGLIREIDRWVTGASLDLALEGEPVTINLSGHSIGEQPILDAVSAAIGNGLDPANVMFEVTETAAMTNLTSARAFVGALNALGCSVALDDFGTGFGSFTYLKHIPGRYLKIDADFVTSMHASDIDKRVVGAIVHIAHSLNKLVIAEGVEHAETLDLLRELGVECAQGFHLGRPKRLSPPTALERELRLHAQDAGRQPSPQGAVVAAPMLGR